MSPIHRELLSKNTRKSIVSFLQSPVLGTSPEVVVSRWLGTEDGSWCQLAELLRVIQSKMETSE